MLLPSSLVLLISLSYAQYKIKVTIETSPDEGNEDTNLYLTLIGADQREVSGEKRLGQFDEGEVRDFTFYSRVPEVSCLKFTLKDGTDGWTMKRTTVVSENGATFTFENEKNEKLDNTLWFQENSLKFCKRTRSEFEIVDKSGRNQTKQIEGLLLFNGGTVCDDQFTEYSARAVCRAMGRPYTNVTFKSHPGEYLYGSMQTRKSIKLDKVKCRNEDWFQCSFTTVHQCKHEEDVFLTCGSGEKSGLSTTIIVIAVAAIILIALIICLCIYCKRRKKQQRPEIAAESLRPEQSAPSAPTDPTAPPQYDMEMAPTNTDHEALPSYDDVVNAPSRFNLTGSFRRFSGRFRRNNDSEKI